MANDFKKDELPDWAKSSPWVIGQGNVTADQNEETIFPPEEIAEFLRLRGLAETIGELTPGSRGRIKWRWVNKKSPFLRSVARLAKGRKARQPEVYFRLVELPSIRRKGGDHAAVKASADLIRVRELAEILANKDALYPREIVAAIHRHWHEYYPNTKRPTPRSIRRHLNGK